MKQYITREQLSELGNTERILFKDIIQKFSEDSDLLFYKDINIGLMMAFILESGFRFAIHFGGVLEIDKADAKGKWGDATNSDLCDKLWQAVKYILSLEK